MSAAADGIRSGLSRAKQHADQIILTGTATIDRPDPGPKTHDDATGKSTRPHNQVWSGGAAASTRNTQGAIRSEAHGESATGRHYCRFPADCPVRPGDRIIFDTNEGDPALTGIELFVIDASSSSHMVQRHAVAVRREMLPAGEWAASWS